MSTAAPLSQGELLARAALRLLLLAVAAGLLVLLAAQRASATEAEEPPCGLPVSLSVPAVQQLPLPEILEGASTGISEVLGEASIGLSGILGKEPAEPAPAAPVEPAAPPGRHARPDRAHARPDRATESAHPGFPSLARSPRSLERPPAAEQAVEEAVTRAGGDLTQALPGLPLPADVRTPLDLTPAVQDLTTAAVTALQQLTAPLLQLVVPLIDQVAAPLPDPLPPIAGLEPVLLSSEPELLPAASPLHSHSGSLPPSGSSARPPARMPAASVPAPPASALAASVDGPAAQAIARFASQASQEKRRPPALPTGGEQPAPVLCEARHTHAHNDLLAVLSTPPPLASLTRQGRVHPADLHGPTRFSCPPVSPA